jgi:hypothetical protein
MIINAAGGTVDSDPWIEKITASAEPAVVAVPSSVRFQFSNAGGTVFLGQRLSASQPFMLTTNNGTLTSSTGSGQSVSAAINEAAGTLAVTLTPAAPGPATVTLTGPCGLDSALGGNSITLNVEAAPTPTPTPSPSPVGESVVWGDSNCSQQVDPVDSLFVLRGDAGLTTNTGDCPDMGEDIEILNASPHIWGDVDCTGSMSPVDSLKLLRFDAGLTASQEEGCPGIGTSVTIAES